MYSLCSFNLGANINNFKRLCAYKDSNLMEDKMPNYAKAQAATAESLLGMHADIFCFQGVNNEDKPIIQKLKKVSTIINITGNTFDNAVALNNKKFKNITNHSFLIEISAKTKKDVAIALATDRLTGQRVSVISAHFPLDENESRIMCHAIAQKLASISVGTLQLIGADMSNSDTAAIRFNIFQQHGFKLHRSNEINSVNPADKNPEREHCFILTKTIKKFSCWEFIKALFFKTVKNNDFKICQQKVLSLDPSYNCSNHLPVLITIDSIFQPSKLSALFQFIKSIFSKE